jgi:hypothetical protein
MSSFVDSTLNHYPEFHREVIRTVIHRLEKETKHDHMSQVSNILGSSHTIHSIQLIEPNGKNVGIRRTKKQDNLSTFDEHFSTVRNTH